MRLSASSTTTEVCLIAVSGGSRVTAAHPVHRPELQAECLTDQMPSCFHVAESS
jgi:hypothetical protein